MSWRIFGDWGTSNLRLFREEGGRFVDQLNGPGIGALTRPAETILRETMAPWRAQGRPSAILLCGMVGSRNGWIEVPYAECPIDSAAWAGSTARLLLDDVPVLIAAGLACQRDGGIPDVIRGEEAQIFGAIAIDPGLAKGKHVMALPGTHSKWVEVEDGRILRFRTFFTGEMFALLTKHSTLTRAGSGGDDGGDESAGYDDGLARARTDPSLLGTVFEARTAQLRAGRSASWARGFLSGLLIGGEIGAATGTQPVTLVGDPNLLARYERALAGAGIATQSLDGERCALAGLELLGRAP